MPVLRGAEEALDLGRDTGIVTEYIEMVYIVAGDSRQAQYWADQWELPRSQWRYVSGPDDLRGLRGADVRTCGTWMSRDDWREILLAVEYHGRKP